MMHKTVVICGSLRYLKEIKDFVSRLITSYPYSEYEFVTPDLVPYHMSSLPSEQLQNEQWYLSKIFSANEVWVYNKMHVGLSTYGEIIYAISINKPIVLLHKVRKKDTMELKAILCYSGIIQYDTTLKTVIKSMKERRNHSYYLLTGRCISCSMTGNYFASFTKDNFNGYEVRHYKQGKDNKDKYCWITKKSLSRIHTKIRSAIEAKFFLMLELGLKKSEGNIIGSGVQLFGDTAFYLCRLCGKKVINVPYTSQFWEEAEKGLLCHRCLTQTQQVVI